MTSFGRKKCPSKCKITKPDFPHFPPQCFINALIPKYTVFSYKPNFRRAAAHSLGKLGPGGGRICPSCSIKCPIITRQPFITAEDFKTDTSCFRRPVIQPSLAPDGWGTEGCLVLVWPDKQTRGRYKWQGAPSGVCDGERSHTRASAQRERTVS